MPTGQYSLSLTVGGISISRPINLEADGTIGAVITLPAGKAGTLTTRTDDNTGVATLSTGHGIATSDVVDVYWSGGVRYGMTATVAVNAVTVDGGAGDILPIATTAVVVVKQVQINVSIDGDALVVLGISLEYASATTGKGHVDCQDVSSVTVKEIDLVGNQPETWRGTVATSYFTGNPITKVMASNGISTEAATLKICGLVDATP